MKPGEQRLLDAREWRDKRDAARAAFEAEPNADTAREFLLRRSDWRQYARYDVKLAKTIRQLANDHDYCVLLAQWWIANVARLARAQQVTGLPLGNHWLDDRP